jgi:hypothetical protein
VRIHKSSHVNSGIDQNRGAGLLSTMSSIYSMFFILTKFEQEGLKNNNEREKKTKK